MDHGGPLAVVLLLHSAVDNFSSATVSFESSGLKVSATLSVGASVLLSGLVWSEKGATPLVSVADSTGVSRHHLLFSPAQGFHFAKGRGSTPHRLFARAASPVGLESVFPKGALLLHVHLVQQTATTRPPAAAAPASL